MTAVATLNGTSAATGPFDLVAGVSEAVPCLDREDAQLVAPFVCRALEMLVGERLTDGMSDDMLDEFGFFVDQDEAGMARWFAANLPDYESRDDFQGLRAANPDADPTAVAAEYGAMQWLQRHRPDYPEVTKACARRVLTALQDAVIEAGRDGLDTWLRFARTAWRWTFEKADCAAEVMACVAIVALREGPEAFALWAQTQYLFDCLAERAGLVGGEAV
jgi:hypothetical protein